MQVILADKAGFCFGVSRAVDTVYREIECGHPPICTFGPIIHNEEVISDLERRGVRVIVNPEEAAAVGEGTVILRSHGVSRAVRDALESSGMTVVDATCPFVGKIHDIVREHSEKGYFILIVGSADHPEVEGIVGWARPGGSAVVGSEEDAEALDLSGQNRICVVSQTTFSHNKFQDIVEIIRKKAYDEIGVAAENLDFVVHNTICSATRERQEAARDLSRQADAMIVIGGASSSNTQKLYEICSANCADTYYIQTKEDLEGTDLSVFDRVGITAGASTPNNIIREVQEYVRDEL